MCSSDTGEATLRIIGVASEDDGVYTCVATNELGSIMSSASLRVIGESTDTQLKQLHCCKDYLTLLMPSMNIIHTQLCPLMGSE